MGYHEDFPTRTAFLKVLTNILNQGTDFEVGGEVDKFDKLYEVKTKLYIYLFFLINLFFF